MIKIGDRVRFLNAVGGGVVTRILKKDLVEVLDADGFEIPVLAKECVVVEEVNRMNFPAQPNKPKMEITTHQPAAQQEQAPVLPKTEEWQEEEDTDYGNQLSLYIAFVPSNLKNLFNSSYDIFLINDSNYSLLFSYATSNHKNDIIGHEQSELFPNTKLFLETVEKEELNKIQQLIVQAVAFKKKGSYALKPTLDFAIKLPLSDLGKLHCFTENDFFEEYALIIPLIEKDLPATFIKPSADEIRNAMMQKDIPEPTKNKPEKSRPRISPIIEVDLHINQLLDSTAGMDNGTMLRYQLDKFRETLEQYKDKKGQKIVFIHGKGEGVLRNEILKEVKTYHKSYNFQDASFREYGFGATMITIH